MPTISIANAAAARLPHAWRGLLCALAFLLPLLPAQPAGAADLFLVKLQESRSPVQNDAQRAGMAFVDRRLQVDNLSMWYHRLVDPRHDDQVKFFSYGDYFMSCRFGGFGNGGWDMEYFLVAEVGYPNAPAVNVIGDSLQQGIYLLEQQERALVDLVWPVPPPPGGQGSGGTLRVRLSKQPGATRWAYLEVRLQATQGAQLRGVAVSGYPSNTSGPPERERWAKTAAQDGNLQSGAALSLDPRAEWAVAMYNRHADEQDANLAVFLPDEVQAARVSGAYQVALALTPAAGTEAVHLALGYYTGTAHAEGNARFLQEAQKVRETLAGLRWQPDFARMVDLDAVLREYAPLLELPGVRARMGKETDGLVADARGLQQGLIADAAAGRPTDYARVLEFTRKIEQVRALRDRLYAAAVEALVEGA